ncbi:peptidase S8/S53 domain-containing protein [Paramyrothecium foliicola]|nr:peptidase S8/S53 domain-containing protein [Paramyrothecium foliicola]
MMFGRQILALVGVAAASAAAVTSNDTEASGPKYIPGAYIVEFEGEQSPDALYKELRTENIDAKTRLPLSYKLFNGVSINVKSGEDAATVATKIGNNRRVKNVWPVQELKFTNDRIVSVGQGNIKDAPKAVGLKARQVAGNSTYEPHLMTQIDRLHAAGHTGKGLRIGIIDSGVDYTHPDLGGCFGPGCLVSYGYDFIGVNIGTPYEPDEDPIDTCFGHGTHVAGIIAAQPNDVGILGVAPDAELGAYRAIDCLGGSGTDTMIAAFNRAYEDGSDIITASLGLEGGWPNDPWSLAVQRIAETGTPVVIAAGNSGELGIFTPSNPAAGRGAASIASVDTHTNPLLLVGATYEVDGSEPEEFGWFSVDRSFGNITKPLYYVGQARSNGTIVDGCSPLPKCVPDLSKYVVLLENGPCDVYTQALNVVEKGGNDILFYGPTEIPEYVGFMPDGVAGVGVIPLSQGKAFVELLLDTSNVTVTLNDPLVSPPYISTMPNTLSGGLTSYWSSWGPNWDLSVNPSFGAPGSQILSTFPLALGSYSVEEGTSMACPFAAAALALVGQARGTLDGRELVRVLTSTARQLTWVDRVQVDPQGRIAPVVQAGTGLLQAWDATQVKGLVSVASISFNDSKHHLEEATFSLENTGSDEATYSIGHTPALTVYAFNEGSKKLATFPSRIADGAAAELEFSTASVKVAAGSSVEIKVKCTAPDLDPELLPVYSGFITLNGTNGDNLVLPYSGVAASMTENTLVFDNENPLAISLTRNGDRPAFPVPADTVFRILKPVNITDPTQIPVQPWPIARAFTFIAYADSRVDVIPLNGTAPDLPRKKWLGYDSIGLSYGSRLQLQARGAIVRSVFTGLLDDLTVVPEGRYQFIASVLKPLGDPENEEHWEVAEIDPFYLEYI